MHYVALGDSITAYRSGVKVYFELLRDEGGLPFTEMTNSGVPGWKTTDLLADLDNRCLRFKPDVVTIMLGTNDHAIYEGESEPAVALADYEVNLRRIVQAVQSRGFVGLPAGPEPDVILLTPPYVATHVNVAGTDVSQERLLAYCRIVKKLALELQTGLIDLNTVTGEGSGWDDRRYFGQFTDREDGVHLNSEGHLLVYPHIRAAIEACIRD